MWMASAERAVDPWAEIRRSGGAAAGRSGAENGQNFRCALFPIGSSAPSRYPWWVRVLGHPGTLRRSSQSRRNANLSHFGAIYHTLLRNPEMFSTHYCVAYNSD